MDEVKGSLRGQILISNSTIHSDYFKQTAILMIEHSNNGAFGLVINKSMNLDISKIIMDLPEGNYSESQIFSGGPVDPLYISILHSDPTFSKDSEKIFDNVYFGRSYELMLNLLDTKSQFRLYQGYCGWGAGQLEDEMKKLSWLVVPPQVDFFYSNEDQEALWRKIIKTRGGIYSYFVDKIKDPMLN
jgi:putative transcriptional regulator